MREGTSDLRIYVAVMSPYPPGSGRYNDHISFVLISMLHVLITCLDVSFH